MIAITEDITGFLSASAAQHSHLCPRQVLGVRIALAGIHTLDNDPTAARGRLMVILEMDGCFADAVQVVTKVSLGQHRLRFEDLGRAAATFVDVRSEKAVRVAAHPEARQRAQQFFSQEPRHYFAQLHAYQHMTDAELLMIQPVILNDPVERWLSRAGRRVRCAICGEEIMNEREVLQDGYILCRACAGQGYYKVLLPE
jgi:formylmethanofuran dehydrogenase subunit E